MAAAADVSPDDRYARVRALVAGADAEHDDLAGTSGLLQRLCRGLTLDLDVAGAAVSLMSEQGSLGVAAASDQRIRDVDDLQFTTGEGPCHDAFASRRPVLTPDLQSDRAGRWPGFTSSALLSGVQAVFAFPLFVGVAGFGVLDLYADRPGALSRGQTATALTFAQVATEILLDGGLTTDGELEPGLSTALDYRAEIHQAQGMVMVDQDIGPAPALALLRAQAFATDRPLIELARDIIVGATLPPRDLD